MVVANAVAALSEINEASVSGQPLVGEDMYIFCLIFVYTIELWLEGCRYNSILEY